MSGNGTDRIDALRRQRVHLLPQDPETAQALDAWYEIELAWSSCALAGGTLGRAEVAGVVHEGLAVGGKPLNDHMAIVDHCDAWRFARALARLDEPTGERDVRHLHNLLTARTHRLGAGRLLSGPREGPDADSLPPAEQLPELIAGLGGWLAQAPPEPATAFEAHGRLLEMQPFAAGNGRTARLLMNLMLLRAECPPAVILPEHEGDYCDALAARRSGDGARYAAFMSGRLLESLQRDIWALSENQGAA